MRDYPMAVERPPVTTAVRMFSKPQRVLGETALIQTDGNALLKAAWLGRLRLVRLLIEGGTDVNKTNDEGQTALMTACLSRCADAQSSPKAKIVRFLLAHGSDANRQDRHGRTALMYACLEMAGPDVVSALLDRDADVRLADKRGSSALVYAVNAGEPDVLRLLVDACKAKGKEVIIITTNQNAGSTSPDTKQYLNVPPPPLPGSSRQCVTPSEIDDLRIPGLDRVGSSEGEEGITSRQPAASSAPRSQQALRSASTASPSEEAAGKGTTHSPPTCPGDPHLQVGEGRERTPSPQDRGSTGTVSQQRQGGEQSGEPTGKASPTARQQLAAAVSVSGEPQSEASSPCASPMSAILVRRRGSLPWTRPPLRKSQTVHSIAVASLAAELPKRGSSTTAFGGGCSFVPVKSCPTSLQGSHCNLLEETECSEDGIENEEEDDDEGEEEGEEDGPAGRGGRGGRAQPRVCRPDGAGQRPAGSRLQSRLVGRRGSAPFILDDELAHTRPGRLPPLKVHAGLPLPGIGGRLGGGGGETRVRSGPSSPCRDERLDRRHSVQLEDLRSLTAFAAASKRGFCGHRSHSSESTESN